MAQSLSNILLHVVFSTKNRQAFIDQVMEPELHAYLATVCKTMKCPAHRIGGTEDHVHVACTLARTVTVSQLIQVMKQDSSKWIKTKEPKYQNFAWQNGYGAFSIGQSQLAALRRYISNQREHHRQLSFKDEFRQIMQRYEIDFDESYVWD